MGEERANVKEEKKEEKGKKLSKGKDIINFPFKQAFSKKAFIFIIPIIFSISLLYFFHDVLMETHSLGYNVGMTIGLFFMISLVSAGLYFLVSLPKVMYHLIRLVNPILNAYCKIKKEIPEDEKINPYGSQKIFYGDLFWDYSYFFVHLVIISFFIPFILLNIYSEPYSKSTNIISEGTFFLLSFIILVVLSSVFFSLHLSGCSWKKKPISPSIFNKLFIPSFIVFLAKISIDYTRNQNGIFNFVLATSFILFLISALSFGFLLVAKYSIERIREDHRFKDK